jgi:molybdate transport system substrate-binding protein
VSPFKTLCLLSVGFAAAIGACRPAPDSQQSEAPNDIALRVITSGGFAAAYESLAPRFEAETGIRLITSYGASLGGADDSIPVRLERGEEFDVVILSQPALHGLVERGDVQPATHQDLARSLVGMAVRAGDNVPNITTPESFVRVLREAQSIAYSASASGTYLSTELFPRLGLWDELAPKSQRIVSERVGNIVARGDAAIGFQQVSELLPIDGITYVGPIPEAYQKVTIFSAGVTTRTRDAENAQQLIAFLSSRTVAPVIIETGLDPLALER